MWLRISSITFLTKMMIIITLTVLLTGCTVKVSNTTGSSVAQTANCGAPPAVQTSPSASYPLFNSTASVDIACSSHTKLHIQTDGIYCGAEVVLKRLQSTYDLGAIKQINTFLNAFYDATVTDNKQYSPQLATQLPSLPETIQVVPRGVSCFADYAVTNIGDESVQIAGMGMTFTGPVVKNTFDYRTIDDCTLPVPEAVCHCHDCGSGGGCGARVLLFVMLNSLEGVAGKHLDAPATADCPNSTTIISPHQLVDIFVSLEPKQTDIIYYVVNPTITLNNVDGGGGNTILNLPSSFSSTLVFANQNRFSCYGFKDQTFVFGWNTGYQLCI